MSVPATFAALSLRNTQDNRRQRSLSVSAAYVDEITQVGESHNELNMTQAIYAEGHILDLASKLGRCYAWTNELSNGCVHEDAYS